MEFLKIKKVLNSIYNEEIKENLKAIKNAKKLHFNEWGDSEYTTTEDKNGNKYRVKARLTEIQTQKPIKEQKEILIKKYLKQAEKEQEKQIKRLEQIEQATQPKEIEISINWKRSQMWGYNPTAQLWAGEYIEGSSVGGCGYDKKSTAAAQVFNQCNGILNAVYNKLNKQNLKYIKHALKGGDTRGVFGYGLHFCKICGAFSGGVGIQSHINILEGLNYKLIAEHNSEYNNYLKFELKTHKRG